MQQTRAVGGNLRKVQERAGWRISLENEILALMQKGTRRQEQGLWQHKGRGSMQGISVKRQLNTFAFVKMNTSQWLKTSDFKTYQHFYGWYQHFCLRLVSQCYNRSKPNKKTTCVYGQSAPFIEYFSVLRPCWNRDAGWGLKLALSTGISFSAYLLNTLCYNFMTDIAPHSQMLSFVLAHQLWNLQLTIGKFSTVF